MYLISGGLSKEICLEGDIHVIVAFCRSWRRIVGFAGIEMADPPGRSFRIFRNGHSFVVFGHGPNNVRSAFFAFAGFAIVGLFANPVSLSFAFHPLGFDNVPAFVVSLAGLSLDFRSGQFSNLPNGSGKFVKLLSKFVETWVFLNEVGDAPEKLVVFLHVLIESGECV